jgi:hypothetical protein
MEQLIFFGVIILLSILDTIARRRKAQAQSEAGEVGGPGAGEPERFEWAQKPPWEDEVPSYDRERSYDDEIDSEIEDEIAGSAEGSGGGAPTRAPRGPGELERLPTAAEILEELVGRGRERQETRGQARVETHGQARGQTGQTRGLARGDARAEVRGEVRSDAGKRFAARQAPALPAPYKAPPSSGPVGRMEARTLEGDPGRRSLAPPDPEHFIHLAHQGFGTDPSERARSVQDALHPLGERMSATAIGVRRDLRGGSAAALRQAIVLKEVLDPPVSLRDE